MDLSLYGGARGIFLTDLLRDLRKPIVTTAHTVLPNPEPDRRLAMAEICELSDAIVVTARRPGRRRTC